ncbi:MAG: hypothetical protein ACXAC8_10730 [Candidatus Hodarchaeales archaeon]|jgi:hypothetical protein
MKYTGKVKDKLLAYQMQITSFYLFIGGLASIVFGYNLSGGGWSLGIRGVVIIFIALISMIIGGIAWFCKSQVNSISNLALGSIIVNIYLLFSLYRDYNFQDYIYVVSSVEFWELVELLGLLLLGFWSFALLSLLGIHLLARYR